MSTLGFFAADTLDMTLYQLNGGLEGSQLRTLRLGPWRWDLPVTAVSDLLVDRAATFWVTIGDLRCYLIVRDTASWLTVLDSNRLHECEATGFVGQTVKDRWRELQPAMVGLFQWQDGNKARWVPLPLTALSPF